MELTDADKQMLTTVHEVYYKAKLIDSPQLANLGLQFTQFIQRVTAPPTPKQELFPPKAEEKKAKG